MASRQSLGRSSGAEVVIDLQGLLTALQVMAFPHGLDPSPLQASPMPKLPDISCRCGNVGSGDMGRGLVGSAPGPETLRGTGNLCISGLRPRLRERN